MVDLIKTVVAAGIGAVDIVLERKGGSVIGPLRAEDIFRIGVVAGSLVADYLGLDRRGHFETAFYAAIPLLEKTVAKMVTRAGVGRAGTVGVAKTGELKLTPLSDVLEVSVTPEVKVETKTEKAEKAAEIISI